jgi:hypothetical protein
MIRYIKNPEIDKNKWDECIENAENGIIYANSWYLDIVSPNWNALILDDYAAIMPIPVRTKYGLQYLYTPKFIQQLGIIGDDTSSKILDSFIVSIPKSFLHINLNLNEQNSTLNSDFIFQKRNNFKLPIDKPYVTIRNGYNRNCIRNLASAEKSKLMVLENTSPEEFSSFIKRNLTDQLKNFSNKDFIMLQKITTECIKRNVGEIISVCDEAGRLVATGSFLHSKNRLIFSVCASSPVGKKTHAMYMLVDHQIKKFAEKYKWFDFSGSNIKGVAYFNSTFGALPVSYNSLIINRLPLFIKVISGKK